MSESAKTYGNPSGMSEGKQMTAVEWLEDVYNKQGRILPTQFEQAKTMEKEEIVGAYIECWMNDGGNGFRKVKEAESYYNEIYGKP